MDSEKSSLLNEDESSQYYTAISSLSSVVNQSDSLDGEQGVRYAGDDVRVSKSTQVSDNAGTSETKVYKRRWYILLAFSLVASTQGGYWNTWGPIAASSEEAFGWTDSDIALLSNWGPIAYIISAVFFSWVIDVKGLRTATLSAAFVDALGAGIRCITDKPPYVKWTVNIGQLLNGLGGPVAMGLPPALSVTWFPPHERTTATAIATVLNSLGVAASFLIGPFMVTDKPPDNTTVTSGSYSNCSIYTNCSAGDPDKHARIQRERSEIMKLMYYEAGWAAFVFLLVLIYFPDKPKLPPSYTASLERLDFVAGLKKLVKNVQFWMISIAYGISLGVFNCWQSVLDVNLKPHDISETEAGWLGFYSTLASCTSSLVVARFADIFSKHMKFFLLLLNVIGAGCMVWFTLLLNGYIPSSVVSLYASIIIGTLFLNATPPLYYETACEVTYPVAEGVTNSMLTLMNNVGGLIFLFVMMIPNIGTAWENWSLIGAVILTLPVLCLMKERYYRLDIDESEEKKIKQQKQ